MTYQMTAYRHAGFPDLYAQAIAHAYNAGYRIYDPSTAFHKDPDIEAKMMRFPAIAAPLAVRHHSISGRRGLVVPPDESGDREKKLSQIVGKVVGKIRDFDKSKLNLARADVSGARYAKVVKSTTTATWGDGKPRTWVVPHHLEDMPKENFRWAPIQGREPKARFEFARKTGGRITWVPVPPGAPLVRHVINDSEEMLGYGRGLRDVLQHLFLAMTRIFAADVQAAERFGYGWLWLRLAEDTPGKPTISNDDLVSSSQTALNRMRADWNFITGKDDELQILGPPSGSVEFMGKLFERLAQMADRVIMGATLFGGGGPSDTGSYARAETEAETGQIIFDACSGFLEDTITNDIIIPFCRDNRENLRALGLADAEPPEYNIQRGRKQDPKAAAERLEIVLRSGAKVVADEYYDLVQLSKPGPEDEVLEGPPEQPMGGPGGAPFQFRDVDEVLRFAGSFGESKVKRDAGRFAKKEGAGGEDKQPHEMSTEERASEIQRLRSDHSAALSTPLVSEGAISGTQLARMGPQQRKEYERNVSTRFAVEARIRQLAKSDEQLQQENADALNEEDRKIVVARERIMEDWLRPGIGVNPSTGKMKPKYAKAYAKALEEVEAAKGRIMARGGDAQMSDHAYTMHMGGDFDESKVKRDAGKFATKAGAGAKKAAKVAWTVAQAWPKVGRAIVEASGAPEPVAKAAYVFASVADWAVPGVPAGSLAVSALATLGSGGKAPYRAAKAAISNWRARRAETGAKVAAAESDDLAVEIARWLAEDPETRAAILAAMIDEVEDPAQAFAEARAFVDEGSVDFAAVNAEATQDPGIVSRKRKALGRGLGGLIRNTEADDE